MYRIIPKCYAVMLLGGVAAAIALSGCGSDGRQTLSGSVTLDNQPLAGGTIVFQPIEGTTGPTSGGAIQDGSFTINKSEGLLPGKYAVSIESFRSTGRMKKEGNAQIPEMVPVRFRAENPLEATIVAGGDNEFDYTLVSFR